MSLIYVFVVVLCYVLNKGETYHSYMEVLLGDGIFNSDGELWRKQRKTASFEFASKNLRDFSTAVFKEYSLKLFTILCQASFKDQQVDMQVIKKIHQPIKSINLINITFYILLFFFF